VVTKYTRRVTQREVQAKPGIVARELDGSFCLVDPDTWQVAVLNETASDLWRLVQQPCSVEEIVRVMAQAYRTQPRDINADVLATLDELRAGGFLVADPA
jgi:hypothetical protein